MCAMCIRRKNHHEANTSAFAERIRIERKVHFTAKADLDVNQHKSTVIITQPPSIGWNVLWQTVTKQFRRAILVFRISFVGINDDCQLSIRLSC